MEREIFDELKGFAVGLETLLETPKDFEEVVLALRTNKKAIVQEILEKHRIYRHCKWLCRWFCVIERSFVCDFFCYDMKLEAMEPKQIMEFARATVRLHKDEKTLTSLITAFTEKDKKLWASLIEKNKLMPFCRPLCRWIYIIFCYWQCTQFCFF